jgi:hypothetical protein
MTPSLILRNHGAAEGEWRFPANGGVVGDVGLGLAVLPPRFHPITPHSHPITPDPAPHLTPPFFALHPIAPHTG